MSDYLRRGGGGCKGVGLTGGQKSSCTSTMISAGLKSCETMVDEMAEYG